MRTVLLLGSAVLLAACRPPLRERIENLRLETCTVVLEEYRRIVAEPDYAEEPLGSRLDLDTEAGRCWLEWRRPEQAKELVAKQNTEHWGEGLMILARAHAQLGEDAEAKAVILQLRDRMTVPVEYFWEHPELGRYAEQEWYVETALERWSPLGEYSLERVVQQLARRGGTDLLSLSVAGADTERPTGEWVVWMGLVRDTRLDRKRNKTVLLVDGMSTKERLTMIDRKVTSFDRGFTGEITPEYEEKRTYEEELVPVGQQFLVEHDQVSEQMVGLRTVTVIGRYAGRAGDDLPKVRMIKIIERKLGERTE